MSPSILFYLMM